MLRRIFEPVILPIEDMIRFSINGWKQQEETLTEKDLYFYMLLGLILVIGGILDTYVHIN